VEGLGVPRARLPDADWSDKMPRLTSIYTKSGDSGRTQLSDGLRVPKDSPRTELLGELDELNAALGVAAASGLPTELVQPVRRVQNELFNLGAELSFGQPSEQSPGVPLVRDEDVLRLEESIDRIASRLGPCGTSFSRAGRSPGPTCTWHAPSVAGQNADL